jgi:hypothetical protein
MAANVNVAINDFFMIYLASKVLLIAGGTA